MSESDENVVEKMMKILVEEGEFVAGLKQKCWSECVKKVKGRYSAVQVGESKCMTRCLMKTLTGMKLVRDIYDEEFDVEKKNDEL